MKREWIGTRFIVHGGGLGLPGEGRLLRASQAENPALPVCIGNRALVRERYH
jgi:hypothetical protein